jgi:hypothetical protein
MGIGMGGADGVGTGGSVDLVIFLPDPDADEEDGLGNQDHGCQ